MKTFGKKLLSMFLVMALVLGMVATMPISAFAAEEETKVLAEELEGYNRILPKDFESFSNERLGNSFTLGNAGKSNYVGNYNGKNYLDVDVNFGEASTAHYLRYLGNRASTSIYQGAFTLRLYANQYGENYVEFGYQDMDTKLDTVVPTQTLKASDYGIESASSDFNVKILTDIRGSAEDESKEVITYQFWLNDMFVCEGSFEETAHERMGLCAQITAGKTLAIKTPGEKQEVKPEPEAPADPFAGYERITLADYTTTGVIKTSWKDGDGVTYQGTANLNKSYLDIDLNFNGNIHWSNSMFRFYGTGKWAGSYHLSWAGDASRLYITRFEVIDGATKNVVIGEILNYKDFGISGPNDWFNVKLKFDVTPHATDSAKQVVKLQLWLNNKLAWEKTLEEASTGGAARNCIYVNATLGTISARVPLTEKDLEGYTPITLEHYGQSHGTKTEVNGYYELPFVNGAHAWATKVSHFNKTYIDVDVNFNGVITTSNASITANVRFQAPKTYGNNGKSSYLVAWNADGTTLHFAYRNKNGATEKLADNLVAADFGINSTSDWFNVKLRTDIVGEDSTQQTATVQLWLNDKLAWMGTLTEDRIEAPRTGIYASTTGTISLRSPISTVEQALEGYTPITLHDYNAAMTGQNGMVETKLPSNTTLTTNITNFDKTYLDLDVNFGGATGKGTCNFRYQGSDKFKDNYALAWNDASTLIFFRYNHAQSITDFVSITAANFGINSASDWFNVKIATDITVDPADSTKQTVRIQLWLNNKLAWVDTVVETRAAASRTRLNAAGTTLKLRSPALSLEEALAGYTPITLNDYDGERVGQEGMAVTTLTAPSTITTQVSRFDKTYLDVDVNFKGATGYGGNNVQFQASARYKDGFALGWNDATTLRFYRYKADSKTEDFATSITAADFGINSPNDWFNVKLITDITGEGTTQQTVKVQLWLNEKLAWIGTVEETRNSASRALIGTAGTVMVRSESPDLDEALEDYTRVTLEDVDNLGASRAEEGTTYLSAKSGEYIGTSLHKTYLDMDVQSTAGCFLTYLMSENTFWGNDRYQFELTDTNLKITQVNGGTTVKGVTLGLGAMGYTAGEMFNLKIRTDIDGTKVVMQIWYNDKYVAKLPFTESTARTDIRYIGIRGTGTGATVVRMPADGTVRKEVAYDLSKGAYLLTGADYFYVNGKKMPSGTALAAPNDYVIERIVDGKIADSKLVSLYYLGDVNLDGSAFESGDPVWKDSHALKGIVDYGTPMKAAMKAADMNNDGKVTKEDHDIIVQIRSDVAKKDEILSKYHTDSLSYDFLGGKDVMPIGGFYGPTTDATLTDGMFKLIQESGINLITYSPADAASDPNRVQQALALAEKYGIGMFVSDGALNVLQTDENGNVTGHTVVTSPEELAANMAAYSNYDSFLGINIVDEPKGADNWGTHSKYADTFYKRYNYYSQLTQALKPYTNITGYINMHGSQSVDDGKFYDYASKIGADVDVLSFDTYLYFEDNEYPLLKINRLLSYLESLDTIRQISIEQDKPFWSFVQAGSDYRDDKSDGPTTGYYTEADTLWIVNTSLAFGAKGIQYFPLLQPEYFSYDNTSETGHDYDRNGIIGANNEANRNYAMVQKANKQIAAIDHVLMNAHSAGVIVTGDAKNDINTAASVLGRNHTFTGILNRNSTYTAMLNNVSDGDAMVGCFNYQGYEAYYVVNYSRTNNQTITLSLNDNAKYYTIADAVKTAGQGSSIALTVPAGAGVLVVLETLHTHAHGDWVETIPATLAAVGQKEKTCVCGDKITEEIPKLAAVNEYGVTLRDDLSMNFKMDVDESIKDTAQVVITVGDKTTTQSVKEVVSVNVSAIQMNDTITVQMVNGNDKSEAQSFTVLQYAQDVLANESMSQYHQMVKEMLNYGGYAQTYFGYNTGNLVNKDLNPDEVGKEEVPQDAAPEMEISGRVEGISAYGAALVLRNKIAVRYYFSVIGDVASYTFTANGKPYEPFTSGDYTCIEVADINPQDLENTITVTVNDTLSFSYSPMTYIVRMSQKGSENMRPLAKALYNYYLAAEALAAAEQ